MKISNPSTNQNDQLELARTRLTAAEHSVGTRRNESRTANLKRNEATEAALRAKKQLKRVKEELVEAIRRHQPIVPYWPNDAD